MKTLEFNINRHMYVQITEAGWAHLENTVGAEYVNNCIKSRAVELNGETWYKLQCWDVFSLMPCSNGGPLLFKTTVMFDETEMKKIS